MDAEQLNSLLIEKENIENKISNELTEKEIREIQREELELLNKILQLLKKEEPSRELSWEKDNLFYAISLLHHNIRFYPTLVGLRSPLIWIDKALREKGVLTLSQVNEMEQVNMDLLMKYINTLIHLVDGE